MKSLLRSISRRFAVVLTVLTMLVGVSAAIAMAPEPDPVPRRWQFDVTFGDLNVANVAGKQYYYLTYHVTNRSGQDLLFAPLFEMVGSEDATIRRSGRNVPASVTESLLKSLGNPMLEDQIAVIGMLQQGPENAKDGLAIWPVENAKPGAVTVFAAGFSGETATVVLPGPAPENGKAPSATLRKTRMVTYQDVGDLGLKPDGPLTVTGGQWVMR